MDPCKDKLKSRPQADRQAFWRHLARASTILYIILCQVVKFSIQFEFKLYVSNYCFMQANFQTPDLIMYFQVKLNRTNLLHLGLKTLLPCCLAAKKT